MPLRAKAAAACNRSVDLPMPGSPPTRSAEAATRPPPSTRSSSLRPEWVRGGAASSVVRSVRGMRFPLAFPRLALAGPADIPVSSEIEFHSPQASQRPDHLEWTAPHALQEKVVLAMQV